MSFNSHRIVGVPTNLITGFLGVGKTSTILHLLKNKPSAERWAVLVNEFGEIGVDGSLLVGSEPESQGIFIREVPGGCMCCAAGLPMHIALNQLLAKAKPDRLLIEPTGLGHPIEVLQTLSADHYREVLSIQKTITLVDARKLKDKKYTTHQTFNQQIAIADVIVGNKEDLYQQSDNEALVAYVEQHCQPQVKVHFSNHGKIDFSILQGPTSSQVGAAHHHHSETSSPLLQEQPLPETGFLKAENQGEGFYSIGWRFSQDHVFNRGNLLSFLSGLEVERMKAVFITDKGVLGYNLTSDALTEIELDESPESRIEIIAEQVDSEWEEKLKGCLI